MGGQVGSRCVRHGENWRVRRIIGRNFHVGRRLGKCCWQLEEGVAGVMFGADMVLKLAGGGYKHAAGAIFVWRAEREVQVEVGVCEVEVEEVETCAPLAGSAVVAGALQSRHTAW